MAHTSCTATTPHLQKGLVLKVQQDLFLSTEVANQRYLKHGVWYLCYISILLPFHFSFSPLPPQLFITWI